ncbi:MAG: glycosyl hydrolase 115 family protein [Bacteroidaceae bacterium]|nr:glycosyl hydrolase 115 family protein [Bacteroidaceae bacterium]
MKKIILSLIALLCLTGVQAAEQFVSFVKQTDAVSITNATISYSENEYEGVKIAIQNLQTDMKNVLGKAPSLIEKDGEKATIIVGTIGKSKAIDALKLADLKGKREKFIITTTPEGQVVIAGSDKRGTIYGVYELSRQLGVSPWYWWADVPVEKQSEAYVLKGTYTDGEPAVEFRGIFLNDEAPCLTSWVKNTWGTDYGDHRFYARVFELILRLRGNMLWPAMWGWAFYADDPENGPTADKMGVIIGTSHHEPMARNHQEWARDRSGNGEWNYQTNQKRLDEFFREGIERMKGTEDIVTIGMRGDGDEAMSAEADTELLQRIVKNQRKIIENVTKQPAKKTTQVWALYKEVLEYYDKGMRVPDDVIMLLCDDNWGNVRRVPTTEKELKHPGGWGLYYHVDYVGAPRNSKWLNVTPVQNMWEQLTLAYDRGIQRMWILNVGDLKPMEYPITLFLDMAWSPKTVTADVVETHVLPFCIEQFGKEQAAEAARILNLISKLNGRCTPEMLDARTYNVNTGEWKQVVDEYMHLETEALRQYLTLEPQYRDAYQQLILFPVQAMANLHEMYYAHAMNQKLFKEGNPDANMWADRVADAFRRDSILCAAYNHDIAGGKWNGMMTQKHIGYRSWNDNFPRDVMPRVQRIENPTPGGYTFQMNNGVVSMEAEHYFEAKATDNTEWTLIPHMGRTRSAMALMPYTQSTEGASLTYRWNGKVQGEVEVHVIVKSTLDFLNKGGMTFGVSIDGGEPKEVNFNHNLNEKPENIYSVYYPTSAGRVVDTRVKISVDSSSETHTLTITPNDPAIVFEKIVIDAGGYERSYLFMDESEVTKQ